MISWNDSSWLWLLATLPLWAGVVWWSEQRRKARIALLLGHTSQEATVRGQPFRGDSKSDGASGERKLNRRLNYAGVGTLKPILRGSLFFFAVTLLMVSAAGPRWGWEWIETRQRGLDIVVAVDVSRSMLAKDLDPSRIERARRMVIDLLGQAAGDRIGLVAFAGEAFVQCPLTSDYGAIRMFTDVMDVNLIPVQGTAVAAAIKTSLKALGTTAESQGKFIVVLSDGEDHEGDLDQTLEDAKKAGVKIFTIGMASSEGAPVPDGNGSFKKDQSGNVVISRLNEPMLRRIAESTGGRFFLAAVTPSALEDLYRDDIRRLGTDHETHASKERVWFERYQWLAGLALILLLGESLIAKFMVGFLFLSLLASGKPGFAASAREDFMQGVKSFESSDFEGAEKAFESAAQTNDPQVKQRSLYNLGHAKAKKGDLQGASKAWQEALSFDPQDYVSRENLTWAQKMLKQQKKDQQQDKGQQKNEEQKDQKQQEPQQKDQQQDQKQQDQKQNSEQKDQQQDQQKNEQKDQKRSDQQKDNQQNGQKQEQQQKSEQQKNDPEKQQEQQKSGIAKDQQQKNELSQNAQTNTQQQSQDLKQMEAKELDKKEAEKLLRMVPDDLGRFYRVPMENQKPKNSEQDW